MQHKHGPARHKHGPTQPKHGHRPWSHRQAGRSGQLLASARTAAVAHGLRLLALMRLARHSTLVETVGAAAPIRLTVVALRNLAARLHETVAGLTGAVRRLPESQLGRVVRGLPDSPLGRDVRARVNTVRLAVRQSPAGQRAAAAVGRAVASPAGRRGLTLAGRAWILFATRTPARIVGLTAVGMVAMALVGGTSASTGVGTSADHPVAAGAAVDRVQAADRADRSARVGAGTAAPTAVPGAPVAAAPPAPKPAPAWVSPMPGVELSSCFGPRWGTMHQGIDFAGNDGTKIVAVGAGTVESAGWVFSGYGMSIVINHGNGYLSHYAHAQKVLVKPGQKVKPGQAIALEGTTGDSTGPHLHFEIHHGLWNQVDPAGWLRSHGVKIGC